MSYSRWLLTDLQVHTPADRAQRYGNVGGPEPNRSFAEVLIRAHADAGVRQGYCVVGLLLVTASMRSVERLLARRVARAMLVSPLPRW